jgi:hypothetical protein
LFSIRKFSKVARLGWFVILVSMKYFWLVVLLVLVSAGGWYVFSFAFEDQTQVEHASFTESEAGFEAGSEALEPQEYRIGKGAQYSISELRNWQRPDGPLRVGLQVGHLDNDQVPEELSGLTNNGAGATAAGYNERDTVAVITELVADQLRSADIAVDVLPATVPPGYIADAFVSIHADGNRNTDVSGFKIAGPRRDYSGLSEDLVAALYTSYERATDLPIDPSISRRMTAYYAFNWPRYEYAVHPYTPSVIVETGFLTNPSDRAQLINQPERAAAGIATGILAFVNSDRNSQPTPVELMVPTLPIVGTVECAPVRAERRNRSQRPCEASIVDEKGDHYLLISEPSIATSSLPYRASVTGEYMPVQMLDNYFWFHWEVVGVIMNAEIERE